MNNKILGSNLDTFYKQTINQLIAAVEILSKALVFTGMFWIGVRYSNFRSYRSTSTVPCFYAPTATVIKKNYFSEILKNTL